MKKVVIGILILIPIMVLMIILAVSNFLQVQAWIAVDDISVLDKNGDEAESVTLVFPSDRTVYDMYEFLDIKVTPDYANRYTIEWRISGDVECMDKEYDKKYKEYVQRRDAHDKYVSDVNILNGKIRNAEDEIEKAKRNLERELDRINNSDYDYSEAEELKEEAQNKFNTIKAEKEEIIADFNAKLDTLTEPELGVVVDAPAAFVDENNKEVSVNTSGRFAIKTYCRFNVAIQVESVVKTLMVIAEGYNVEKIELVNTGDDDSTLQVGEKMMLEPNYKPLSSIVKTAKWTSSDPSVASVDQNGVITAHKSGTANIVLRADRFDGGGSVDSTPYTVTVEAGLSKFGESFSTSKSSFTLEEAGIVDEVTSWDGCNIVGNIVTFDDVARASADGVANTAVAHITTVKGTVTVSKCEDNDIVIENADCYSAASGYVFAVSELTLKLKAVWKDVLKEGFPSGVVWSAQSANNIATITENGEVTATESGLAEITAECNGSRTTLILNLQLKLVSMKLRTGNDYMRVGLALETVFAAERYKDVSINHEKEANSTLIQIVGAPKRTDNDTDESYKAKLAVFYNAFTYEILSGSEYAAFDSNEVNRLVFKPSALEGLKKQIIKVRVRAKYPRYSGEQNFIQEEVEFKVVYGVEVSNIQEMRAASADQEAYAKADDNLQPRELVFEHTVKEDHDPEKYKVYNSEYSLRTYAMSIVSDIAYEEEIVELFDSDNIKLYGDCYGNGHWISARQGQVHDVDALIWIKWSNVTLSNLNIRANRLDKNGMLSTDETSALKGEGFEIFNDDRDHSRITGVRIEYSIVENAKRAGQAYNSDFIMDGVIIRNIASLALYLPSYMLVYEEGGEYITYPSYIRVVMNNCAFSNCIATLGDISIEGFTRMYGEGGNRPMPGAKVGEGRFVRGDLKKNDEYFMEHFAKKGINAQFKQTGFIDIYNWRDANATAGFIDLGTAPQYLKDLFNSLAGRLVTHHPIFEEGRYYDAEENITYYSLGIMVTGMQFNGGLFDEPILADIELEDPRFAKPAYTLGMQPTEDSEYGTVEKLLGGFSIKFYGFTSDFTVNDITPYSVLTINEAYIRRLHEGA